MEDPDQMVSLSDPGEVGRAEHNKGDRTVISIGNVLAWLFPILMLCITAQVIMRQAGFNQAWLDDLQWWIYGIACLVGIAFAVTTNSHVRVDIFYDNYDKPKQHRTDLFGLGWLFLPFTLIVWDTTLHFAVSSVMSLEGSSSPNGLHNQWILKLLMNASFILIAVAIIAAIVRLLKQGAQLNAWTLYKWTFPAIAFAANLIVFYGAWWLTRLTNPDMATRQISRKGLLMSDLEYGPFETGYTVLVGLALAVILGAILFVRRPR